MSKVLRFEILLVITGLFLVMLGMSSTLAAFMATPANRVYTGMFGYSDDYIGYTSMIKEGIDGQMTMKLRSLPKPQGASPLHIVYIWIGNTAGLFTKSAPVAYHVSRALFGMTFFLVTFTLFYRLFKRKIIAYTSTIISFTSGTLGLYLKSNVWTYKPLATFPFVEDVNTRLTTRHHYMIGAIIFITIILLILKRSTKQGNRKNLAVIGVLSFLLSIIHVSSSVVLLSISGIMILYSISRNGIKKIMFSPFLIIIITGTLGLLFASWSTSQYPNMDFYPLIPKDVAESPYFSLKSFEYLDLSHLKTNFLAFGPTLWLAILGFSLSLTKNFMKKESLLMILWFIFQMSWFFFFYPLLHFEQVRFIQTLFYIPMAYGTVVFLLFLGKRFGLKWFYVLSSLLIILFIPNYLYIFKSNLTNYTNFKDFTIFTFPTKKQVEAFKYLDDKTEKDSRVLASYEAANLLMIFSHDYIWGNPHMWVPDEQRKMLIGKDIFLTGSLPEEKALAYLKKNNINYIYYGYQEMSAGDIRHYSFLDKIFENTEVEIYRVNANKT